MFNLNDVWKKKVITNKYGTYLLIISDKGKKFTLSKMEKTTKEPIGFGAVKPQVLYKFEPLTEADYISRTDTKQRYEIVKQFIEEGNDPKELSSKYREKLRHKQEVKKSLNSFEKEQAEAEDNYKNRPIRAESLWDLTYYEKLTMFDLIHKTKTESPRTEYSEIKELIFKELNIDLNISNTNLATFYRDECRRQGVKHSAERKKTNEADSTYNLTKELIYKSRKEDGLIFRKIVEEVYTKTGLILSESNANKYFNKYCKEIGDTENRGDKRKKGSVKSRYWKDIRKMRDIEGLKFDEITKTINAKENPPVPPSTIKSIYYATRNLEI